MNVSAQTWSYSTGGNDFDGSYKIASVQGKGNDYPYTDPTMLVRNKADGSVEIFISGVGYVTDESVVTIILDGDKKHVDYYGSPSIKKNAVFLSFSGTELADLITDMKTSNKMVIRYRDNYGTNDMSFSLSGSTRALNSTLGDDFVSNLYATDSIINANLTNVLRADSAWSMYISDGFITNFADVMSKHWKTEDIDLAKIQTIEFVGTYGKQFEIWIDGESTYKKAAFNPEVVDFKINGEVYEGQPLFIRSI